MLVLQGNKEVMMKYSYVFIICFSVVGCSTNNTVSKIIASSSTETSPDGKVVTTPLSITELTLDTCDVTLSNSSAGGIRLEFADRIFEADNLSFSKKANDSCLVRMKNGELIN